MVSVGDMVQICSDLDRAQVLNKRVGWKPEMDVVSLFSEEPSLPIFVSLFSSVVVFVIVFMCVCVYVCFVKKLLTIYIYMYICCCYYYYCQC